MNSLPVKPISPIGQHHTGKVLEYYHWEYRYRDSRRNN